MKFKKGHKGTLFLSFKPFQPGLKFGGIELFLFYEVDFTVDHDHLAGPQVIFTVIERGMIRFAGPNAAGKHIGFLPGAGIGIHPQACTIALQYQLGGADDKGLAFTGFYLEKSISR